MAENEVAGGGEVDGLVRNSKGYSMTSSSAKIDSDFVVCID
jgi:hypothetical protein